MPAGKSYTSFILEDQNTIIDFIGQISTEMYDYIEEHQRDSRFVLFYKHLTHSDLATFGKGTHPNSHEKNLLYYIKTDDMLEVERKTNKPFQIAIGSTGEPTIHPEFCEFLETVYNTGVVPNYTTNGITIAKDNELSNKILAYTRRYVGGVAVSFGNKSLQKYAVANGLPLTTEFICF